MSSTPLTKKEICRLWGVNASFIDTKMEEILSIVERDIDESYLLQKLNKHGMDIENVIIDVTESDSNYSLTNTNNNNNQNTNNNQQQEQEEEEEEEEEREEEEIRTTLHKYAMIGPYSRNHTTRTTYEYKWNCDNKKCTKHRNQRAYNIPYYKSKQLGDEFTLCQKCVTSYSNNPLETNQNIKNTNCNYNTTSNKRRRNRKRKRSISMDNNENETENIIQPKTKKRKITNSTNNKQKVTEIITEILNENNNKLTRDKLVSLLNKQIKNNNGISWRKTYRSELGNIDEFIQSNNTFNTEDTYKRNYIIQLNENNENNENNATDSSDSLDIIQQINDIDIQEEEKSEEKSDNELTILPNTKPKSPPRRSQRILNSLSLSPTPSDDIEMTDKNDSDYELSDSPTDNVFALYRYKNKKGNRNKKRKINLKEENDSDFEIENTNNSNRNRNRNKKKKSMKEEADSDDEQNENNSNNIPPTIPILPKPKKKVPKWKFKLFNPLKIKYNIKPKPVKARDPEIVALIERHPHLAAHFGRRKEKEFDSIKPIKTVQNLYDLQSSHTRYDEIISVIYDKDYICNDKNKLKLLYDKSFNEIWNRPKKPKPKKKKESPKKKERKDWTIQCEIKKTKALHSISEKVSKKFSCVIDITLNRLAKTGNIFNVPIPATMALICRSKDITKDVLESINIEKEYNTKGHENTSISLLDFACRYNDDKNGNVDTENECKICYKSQMINPKAIPCGCMFCNKCIWKYFITDDGDECPSCEKEWDDEEWQSFVFDDDDLENNNNNSDEEGGGELIMRDSLSVELEQESYGLNVIAFPYQVQSIEWMIEKETNENGLYDILFQQGQFKNGEIFYYSSVLNRLVLTDELPIIRGGWLCEEMGLGKTIEIIALINSNKRTGEYSTSKKSVVAFRETALRKRRVEDKSKNNNNNNNPWNINNRNDEDYGKKKKKPKKQYKQIEEEREFTYYKGKGTLIIGPVSLIGQWENEIDKMSKKKLTYKRYYGQRTRNIKAYLDFDIVFTTYGVIAKEDGMDRKNHILHKIQWHRIVLDESHYIKNGTCRTAINSNELKGTNKWLLSGTPFNTQVDLENQLRFLGFKNEYLNAMNLKKRFYSPAVLKVVKYMMMRHKKAQKFNDKPIVLMPEKEEDIIYVQFDAKQKEYYDKLYKIAKETFDSYAATGNISRGFIPILSSLHPARQACSGYIANMNEIEKQLATAASNTEAIRNMVSRNRGKSAQELYQLARVEAYNKDGQCVICLEVPPELPLQTQCNHIFCGECIREQLRQNGNCPICRTKCDIGRLKRPMSERKEEEVEEEEGNDNNNGNNIFNLSDENVIVKFDAKLKVLVSELNKLRINKPNDKSLIFTSFSKSLNWITSELDENNIKYCTLTGSMPMQQRANMLKRFANDSDVSVFVLTVRTGAVGLTLTAANHVFMMEPTINPSLHRQAINRVYRLGQEKKVFIHTLIMKDSIEERIWNINKEKQSGDIDNKKNKAMYGNIKEDKAGGLETTEIEKLFRDTSQRNNNNNNNNSNNSNNNINQMPIVEEEEIREDSSETFLWF